MHPRTSVPLLLVCVLLIGGCSEAAGQPTVERPAQATAVQTQSHAKEIDALFRFIKEDAPGAAVMMIKDGAIVYAQGYGRADRKRRTPITPQTAFHLASAGKQFTAMGIMMLQEEGKLEYDDPLGMYLPELAELGDDVTIRRLLQHTAGLPGHETDEESVYSELLEQASEPTNSDLVELLSGWEAADLPSTPGDQYDYSNVGYELLGALIERVSGQVFDDFLQERIFGPLEMQSTFSLPNKERYGLPNRARGYDAEDSSFQLNDSDPLDNLVGSGSVFSTVEDLYRYDQALYTARLVPQKTLAEAFAPAVLNDGTMYPYGFGWELGKDGRQDYVGHSGVWEGYLSYILRFPKERLSVFVLSNRSDSDPESLALEIARLQR